MITVLSMPTPMKAARPVFHSMKRHANPAKTVCCCETSKQTNTKASFCFIVRRRLPQHKWRARLEVYYNQQATSAREPNAARDPAAGYKRLAYSWWCSEKWPILDGSLVPVVIQRDHNRWQADSVTQSRQY